MPRLPPALEVFPTLKRFPALRPRRLFEVPIGCRRTIDSEEILQHSALHLYHDLGVLVFAGCSVSQVTRIGHVLRQVVAWGGPGGVVSMLDGWEQTSRQRRERPLRGGELHESAIGMRRTGVIKSEALLRLANQRFRDTLKGHMTELRPEVKDVHIQETQVIIPGSPPARGIIHRTISGPRNLPVDSFTSLAVDRVNGHTIGEARFFTAGTGDYVGATRIDYVIRHYDPATKTIKPFWGHGKLKQRRRMDPAAQKETLARVVETVMRPLWEVEQQVWADKADELVRSREKKEWEEAR